MRFQPKNPNTAHPNRHELYLACTGGGKSQMLRHNLSKLPASERIILWDQAGDHTGLHYQSQKTFLTALKAGLKRGGGFRIAYAGPRTVESWEWFCEVVWACLDGNKITHLVAEELSAVCPSAGRATPNAEVLLNEGRKYGLIFHGTSQKPQAVAKTYFDQCDHKYIGRQKTRRMCIKMAEEIGVEPDAIGTLEPLQFWYDDGSADPCELVKIRFRKVSGVHWRP